MRMRTTFSLPLLALLAAVLFPGLLSGLDPARSLDQYARLDWTVENKLPGNSVVSLAQPADGYLWIAHRQQLSRFNGIKFHSYRLFSAAEGGHKEITGMTVDNDGALWIGTRGKGLYKYRNDVFEIFIKRDGLSSDYISFVYCDLKNNLWIGTDEGILNRLTGTTFTTFDRSSGLPDSFIYSILEDSRGNLWIGTRGSGLYRFQNERFIHTPVGGESIADVMTIFEDSAGGLWLGTNRGLVNWAGNTVIRYHRENGLTDHVVYSVIQDNDRNLWTGTGDGLFRIRRDISGAARIEKSMDGSVVKYLFEDREKSIWIGTDGKGVTQLRDGKIRTFSTESGLPHEYVVYMHEARNRDLWVGTMDGLVRFEGGRLERESMRTEFSEAVVGPVVQDSAGDIWFGTYGSGLFRIKDGKREHYTTRDGLVGDTIISLFAASGGELWIGSDRGLCSYSGGVFKPYRTMGELLKTEIYCFFEDKKNVLWIGTNKGLIQKRGHDFVRIAGNRVPDNPMVSYIFEDSAGVTWVATKGNGLIRVMDSGNSTVINTQNGLYRDVIYQVFEDGNGFFWMSCDQGVFKVAKKQLNQLADGSIQRIDSIYYGKNDGMKSPETSRWGQHSSIQTADGRLLFGTTNGISIVDPENIKISKTTPAVVLEQIIVNDVAIKRDKEKYAYPSLDYIQFHFRAATLISPEKIKYRYRLEGSEEKWIEVKSNRIKMANYNNLAPGEYTFHVLAANADGIWAEQDTNFTFSYAPRFTQSLVFKLSLLFVLLAAGVLIFLVTRRFLALRRQKDRYKDSSLDQELVQRSMKKLLYVMDIEKVYKDDSLSLQILAEKIAITPHILSQVINEQMEKNFSDFVNGYRIEESKRMLQEADEETSILHICYEVGFNSKSAFYRAFKKFTDKTPSQFQKELKKK